MSNINQIALKTKCPKCGKPLSDHDNLLDNMPSIRLGIKSSKGSGFIRLSSVYGSSAILSDIPLAEGEVYVFSCPVCKQVLESEEHCSACKAPMVYLLIEMGGKVNFCSRKGCYKHSIEFEDISTALKQLYEHFDNYSGKDTQE